VPIELALNPVVVQHAVEVGPLTLEAKAERKNNLDKFVTLQRLAAASGSALALRCLGCLLFKACLRRAG